MSDTIGRNTVPATSPVLSDFGADGHDPAAHPKQDQRGQSAPTARSLRLRADGLTLSARALLLRGGETLVSVNGKSFEGGAADLNLLFRQAERTGKPLALTFLRNGNQFTVLAQEGRLGDWEVSSAPPMQQVEPGAHVDQHMGGGGYGFPEPPDARYMVNWEVFRDDNRNVDLHADRTSLLALLVPVLWLAKTRLWPIFGAILVVHVFSLVGGLELFAATYILIAAYVWRARLSLLRSDRISRGMRPWMVIAARNEVEAQKICRFMDADIKFAFEGAQQI